METQQSVIIYTPDYNEIKNNFLTELRLSFQGKPSSISFLKYYLPKKPLLTKGIVQGIVIGGTNYTVSTEEILKNNKRKVLKTQQGQVPVFHTKELFIDFLSKHLDQRAEAIGINFGFPIELRTGSYGENDAVLLYGTKEHAFKGLTEPIGQVLKSIFQEKYNKSPKVAVANDTVCLDLAGDGTEIGAFVAATGFNMCLGIREDNQKVLVNLESGNFNKFTPSPILTYIDTHSENPGMQLFEKYVSGRYLAEYFNESIKKHDPKALISTTKDLSTLSLENSDISGDMARAILTRSAYLVACAIAAVYEFSIVQRTVPSDSAISLIGEGSLLSKGWQYKENIYKQLHRFGISSDRIEIKHYPQSDIRGAIGLLTQPVV